MNTIKDSPIPTILDYGRKEFYTKYGRWPNLLVMGDKYFNQLSNWYGCDLNEIWNMKIQRSSSFNDLELVLDKLPRTKEEELLRKMAGE